MNKILKKYHIVISITFLFEVLVLGLLFLLFVSNDDISNDVTFTYYVVSLCVLFGCVDFIESFIFVLDL